MIGGRPGEIDELVFGDRWEPGVGGETRCGDLMIGLDPDNPQRVIVEAQPGLSAGLHRARAIRVLNEYLPLAGYGSLDGLRDLIALISWRFAEYGLPEPPDEGLDEWYAAAEPIAVEALEEARAEAAADAAEALDRLPGRTAAQLLAEVPEEVDWLVPGVLARRWAVKIAGREKDGKGTFVYYLLGRLERGEGTVFGPAAPDPVTAVIYTEEPWESAREKVETFGLQRARVVYGYELADYATWREKVAVLVRTAVVEGHGIVFVDNISRATGIEDEGGVEFARAVEIVIDACRVAGIACIIDHHHKKGRDRLENKSRGGTGVAGATDVNIELTHPGGWTDRRRKISARGRLRATIWEKTIALNEAGNDYTDAGDAEADEETERDAELLLDRMKLQEAADSNGGKVTALQFAVAIDKSKDTAARRLGALVEAELATKDTSERTHAWLPTAASPQN